MSLYACFACSKTNAYLQQWRANVPNLEGTRVGKSNRLIAVGKRTLLNMFSWCFGKFITRSVKLNRRLVVWFRCLRQKFSNAHFVLKNSFVDGEVFTGNSSGPCTSGNYFFTSLPKTNLFLLVIENWTRYRQSFFYNFNCHISNQVFDAGTFRIVNGTCKHIDDATSSQKKETCPKLRNIDVKCSYNKCIKRVPSLTFTLIMLTKFIFADV